MKLAFDEISNKPQTHILIIGVGNYPYTIGGTNYVDNNDPFLSELEQLTSPIESALFFYKKMLDFHNAGNWAVPLGSIELLCDAPIDENNLTFDSPTLGNIARAYGDWKERCNTYEDNIAIFFFCGHGLQGDDHYLLCSDFGLNKLNIWTHAFAFDATRSAFNSCKAKTQIFFVDACRKVTAAVLTNDIQAMPLEIPSKTYVDCAYNLTLKAACNNRASFGLAGQPSFFTKGLIRGMMNDGYEKEREHWVVSTGEINKRIISWIGMENAQEGYKQRCDKQSTDSFSILKSELPPQVPVEVDCHPSEARALAKMYCRDPNNKNKIVFKRTPEDNTWNLSLPSGVYLLQAKFTTKQYKNIATYTSVHLPAVKETLKLS